MGAEQQWIVETRELTRIYGDGSEIRALDAVNLRIAAGELVAVMGPSGSGKSTLLNMLGALDKPTSGQVFVAGQDLARIRNKDRFRSHTVGFVFQLHNLLPTLSALENVEVPMIGQLGGRQRRKRARELLELVGLQDRLHHLPNQLSGGQRQRVAVARALANNPPLVLADEPTGSLDTVSGQDLAQAAHRAKSQPGHHLPAGHTRPGGRTPNAPRARHGRWHDRPRRYHRLAGRGGFEDVASLRAG